jgi:hypothetical protein
MAKTNANFNLSKSVKLIMATMVDPNKRAIFKRAMIDAEHSYIVNRHRKPRENNSNREAPSE